MKCLACGTCRDWYYPHPDIRVSYRASRARRQNRCDYASRDEPQHYLARAYLEDGQVEEAIGLFEHVVKYKATTPAETNPSRLSSEYYLACAYLDNGYVEGAIGLIEYVIKIETTKLAERDPDALASQKILAKALELRAEQYNPSGTRRDL
jgi:tetratricopeptide (TPR) repeat protein